MKRVGIYDQIKAAIQDFVAPTLHEIRGELQAVRAEVQGTRVDIRRLDEKSSMKNELVFEIRRVDVRIDSMERELRRS